MVTALFDTSILLDYLLGDARTSAVFKQFAHRALSVITWVEVLSVAPQARHDSTRAFLRSFERLSISEAIADEALRLIRERPGLPFHRALTWATASVNRMTYVTVDRSFVRDDDKDVLCPYAWSPRAIGASPRKPAPARTRAST
jgi:predicted nucleic acid-binding protein